LHTLKVTEYQTNGFTFAGMKDNPKPSI